MTAQDYMAPESVGRLQQRAVGVCIAGVVACGIGYFLYGDQYFDRFFHSYLVAFMFVLGLSLGSLGLLMLQHLTGGHWGIMTRRPLEAAGCAGTDLQTLFFRLIAALVPAMRVCETCEAIERNAVQTREMPARITHALGELPQRRTLDVHAMHDLPF